MGTRYGQPDSITERIGQRIETAAADQGLDKNQAYDVAFHMLDWFEDYKRLRDFFDSPESHSDDRLSSLLMRFLIHAPNHIAAAAKLFADAPVEDIFDVGAIKTETT